MANAVSACRKEIEEPGSQEKVNSVIKARDTPIPFYFVEVEKFAFYSYVKADEDLPSKYFCTTKEIKRKKVTGHQNRWRESDDLPKVILAKKSIEGAANFRWLSSLCYAQ